MTHLWCLIIVTVVRVVVVIVIVLRKGVRSWWILGGLRRHSTPVGEMAAAVVAAVEGTAGLADDHRVFAEPAGRLVGEVPEEVDETTAPPFATVSQRQEEHRRENELSAASKIDNTRLSITQSFSDSLPSKRAYFCSFFDTHNVRSSALKTATASSAVPWRSRCVSSFPPLHARAKTGPMTPRKPPSTTTHLRRNAWVNG